MMKAYSTLLALSSLAITHSNTYTSEPADPQSSGYVVIEPDTKAPQKKAVMLDFPEEPVVKKCVAQIKKTYKKLTSSVQELIAPHIHALSQTKSTPAELTTLFDPLHADATALLMPSTPLPLELIKIHYEKILSSTTLSPSEVYPALGISTPVGRTISLGTIQQKIAQKIDAFTQEVSVLEQELRTLKITLAQTERPDGMQQIAPEEQEKIKTIQQQIPIIEARKNTAAKNLAQHTAIERIFSSAVGKRMFDAYLAREEAIEKIKISERDEKIIQKLLTQIEACKKELAPKKTTIELPSDAIKK